MEGIPNPIKYALYAGGAAIVPLAVTALIAASKAIFINIIANVVLTIITAGTMGISIGGISLIKLPLLMWQVSLVSAAIGGGIIGLALLALAAFAIYKACQRKNATV